MAEAEKPDTVTPNWKSSNRVSFSKKLETARADYELLRATITHTASNDTEDTSPTFRCWRRSHYALKEESGHQPIK